MRFLEFTLTWYFTGTYHALPIIRYTYMDDDTIVSGYYSYVVLPQSTE